MCALETDPQAHTFTVSARVCLESGGVARTVRIVLIQVLNYWTDPPTYSRNGFKQGATTEDVALTPAECQIVRRSFTLDAESWATQGAIRFIAWAQVPAASGPAAADQAAIMPWPFVPDCNDNGVPDAIDISSGGAEDCNANGVPDECEHLGDLNCDGRTDFDDINPFVEALVSREDYEGQHPACLWLNGDIDGSGVVDFDDINPFVALLAGS